MSDKVIKVKQNKNERFSWSIASTSIYIKELINFITEYLINSDVLCIRYVAKNSKYRERKIKYVKSESEKHELWVLDYNIDGTDIKRYKYVYTTNNAKSILTECNNFRLVVNDKELDNQQFIDLAKRFGYEIEIITRYNTKTTQDTQETEQDTNETEQDTNETEQDTQETEQDTNETEQDTNETEQDKQETEDKVIEKKDKTEYKPSYDSSEELKELFNCQDRQVKPNVRVDDSEHRNNVRNQTCEQMKPLEIAVEANKKLTETPRKEFRGCEKCNYTTYIEMNGIKVLCDCVAKHSIDKKNQEVVDTKPEVKIKDLELMNDVIPLERRNDEFSSEESKRIVTEMLRAQGFKVFGYYEYLQAMNNILAKIATSGLQNSYIIGAPNGFGKTTFVYTAIKRLIAKGKKVVPFMSLTELAEIRLDYKEKLLKKLRNDKYIGEKDNSKFTWKDYIESDVLFTCLSSAESKEIESLMLYDLLKIRGKNGKPTIVMVSQSLQWYTSDAKLNERYWSDILSYKGDSTQNVGMDRLIHISCYKRAFVQMGVQKGVDY